MTQQAKPLKALSESALQRKLKALDAREAYIDSRELINATLDDDIAEKERQLYLVTNQAEAQQTIIDTNKADLAFHEERIRLLTKAYDDKVVEFKSSLKAYQDKLDIASLKVKNAAEELREVKAAIEERHEYQLKQEREIADAALAGNTQLQGIDYEITAAQQVVKDLKTETRNLKKDKVDIAEDVATMQNEAVKAEEVAEGRIAAIEVRNAELLTEFNQLNKQNADARVNYALLTGQTDEKLKILSVKEQELLIREQAVINDRNELEEEKHHWAGTKRLYNIQ